jgi:hypothetical protein
LGIDGFGNGWWKSFISVGFYQFIFCFRKLPLNWVGFTNGSAVTNKLSAFDSLPFSELANRETVKGSSLLRLFK